MQCKEANIVIILYCIYKHSIVFSLSPSCVKQKRARAKIAVGNLGAGFKVLNVWIFEVGRKFDV